MGLHGDVFPSWDLNLRETYLFCCVLNCQCKWGKMLNFCFAKVLVKCRRNVAKKTNIILWNKISSHPTLLNLNFPVSLQPTLKLKHQFLSSAPNLFDIFTRMFPLCVLVQRTVGLDDLQYIKINIYDNTGFKIIPPYPCTRFLSCDTII